MAAKKKNSKNWYLLIEGRESGPFDYEQVVKKITDGEVLSFHFVKALNQETWGTIADHEMFSEKTVAEEIKIFSEIAPAPDGRRRHPRSPILADVFVKRDGLLTKGKAIEIAQGGMGIDADSTFGNLGDEINIYCSPISESIAFNCQAKIVNKTETSPNRFRYGIQFLKISRKGESYLIKILSSMENLEEEVA